MHCRAWQRHLAVLEKHPLDTSGHWYHWGLTESVICCADTPVTYWIIRGKLGFTNGILHFPSQPGKALHTHTHTPRCQFRMAQAVKKSVQSNEHHLEQWEPVSFLYFAHAMLSFPRNSKLSLHANAIFPVLLPGANWVFPQPGALHKDVMEWESYCTTRAYSTGSSMQCDRACIRSGLHKEK